MGVVYLAADNALKRDVALKKLASDLTNSPEIKRRFLLEAPVFMRNGVAVNPMIRRSGLTVLASVRNC